MYTENNILGIVFKHRDCINSNSSEDVITIEQRDGKSGGSYIYNEEEKFQHWSMEDMANYLNSGLWIEIGRTILNYEIY